MIRFAVTDPEDLSVVVDDVRVVMAEEVVVTAPDLVVVPTRRVCDVLSALPLELVIADTDAIRVALAEAVDPVVLTICAVLD